MVLMILISFYVGAVTVAQFVDLLRTRRYFAALGILFIGTRAVVAIAFGV
jgi:hypothetical protein